MGALEDKDEIRELLARYNHHIDNGEFEAWLSLWTKDAVFEPQGLGRFSGLEELRKFTESIPAKDGVPILRHCITNEVIEIRGDEARVRSYLLLATAADQTNLAAVGRYEDTVRRVGGRWRFAHRVFKTTFGS